VDKVLINKDDFVQIEYTGKTKSENVIFDTTDAKIAKDNHMQGENYGPMVIQVGAGSVLKGLDSALVGKEEGKDYHIEIKAEDAFGKKSAKNIQLISTAKFHKQQVNPMPGMQVTIDNMIGIIKTVTGGRTLVDFNHPLASQDLVYHVKINRIVTDDKEKADALLGHMFGKENISTEFVADTLKVKFKTKLPKEIEGSIEKKVKEAIPGIGKVEFVTVAA
jgi:FKBP-type peptidyl-prolyl cis-trans isomerase SlyD